MATTMDATPLFATALRWPQGRAERYIRTQREAGRIPTGKRGGGRTAIHLTAEHLASVVLGFAGHEPSDSSDAADALAGLRFIEERVLRAQD